MSNDILDRLAAYRPTPQSVEPEWSADRRASVVGEILDPADGVLGTPRVVAQPRHRYRLLAPIAASVAVIAVVGGAVAWDHSRSGGVQPGGGPSGTSSEAPGTKAPEDRVGAGQYTVRGVDLYISRGSGHRLRHDGHDVFAVNPAGDEWYRYAGVRGCSQIAHNGTTSFGNPTRAFFDGLPTDPAQLEQYLRSHVSGSSSRGEAVFTAVGDMLNTSGGLASSALRRALVTVLSRTEHVTVHRGVTDQLGRPADRADFADPQRRPGEVSSLYFAPDTAALLEQRESGTGNGGKVIVNSEVTTSDRIVDALPRSLRHCTVEHDH